MRCAFPLELAGSRMTYCRVTGLGLALVLGLGTASFAQGGRPWVDPPTPQPGSGGQTPSATPAQRRTEPASPSTGREPGSSEARPRAASEPPNARAATAPPRSRRDIRQEGPRRASVRRDGSVTARSEARQVARTPEPAPRVERVPLARPTFRCRNARTSVERAICADPVLAAKDRTMARLYERAGGSRFGPVDSSQWRWLAARNSCARASSSALGSCVHRLYDARIAELRRY